MKEYKAREIRFRELVEINGWKVKIYTINKSGPFDHPDFYRSVVSKIPEWVELKNGFNSDNYSVAFLILHAGAEGIFSLINWWVGGNMLNTNIYLTEMDSKNEFEKISGNGLSSCVWELEVIHHEGTSWLNNVLKKEANPDFEAYLKDVINTEL